jgi:hypothetical protein
MVLQRNRYVKLRSQKKEQKRLAVKLEALKSKFNPNKSNDSFDSKDAYDAPSALASEVTSDDLSLLTTLQDEMQRLRAENDRLKQENNSLKDSGRKEHFSLDSKIAVVAVGKATIQNLEREKDSLKVEVDRLEKTLKQFKVEKQHVVENLVYMSHEVDVASKEFRKYKKMYDFERAIRLSQVLREREIMKHVRNLLRLRGVEYSRITEVKSRMCEIIALNKPDPETLAPEPAFSDQPLQGNPAEDLASGKVRRQSAGSRNRRRRTATEDVDGASMISSVSTHVDSPKRRSQSPMLKRGSVPVISPVQNSLIPEEDISEDEMKNDAQVDSNWWNNIFSPDKW